MSDLGSLLDHAHKIENEAGRHLTAAVTQRRASRPVLLDVAKEFRRAADLIDQAVALLPSATASRRNLPK